MYRKSKHKRAELLSTPELRERGWTPAVVRDLLGEPDDTRPNPRYSSAGAPMRFWLKERVEAIEGTAEFRDSAERARRRVEGSRKAVETKRQELTRLVGEIGITVPSAPLEQVTREAIQSFNRRGEYRAAIRGRLDEFEPADEGSDPEFLARITVNYLRHERTAYDDLWKSLAGRVGKDDAHELLRERVLRTIGAVYPDLAEECERQVEDWLQRRQERRWQLELLDLEAGRG